MKKSNLFFKGILTNIIFSVIFFLCAGKIYFLQGWIFLATNIISTLMNVVSIRNNEIIEERSKISRDAKSWDKKILGLSAVVYLASIIVAGFDAGRFAWSLEFHWSFYILGVLLTLLGQLIFLTARNQNNFFSVVVRIQTERGHTVCDEGLYKIIRHPGYSGMILSLIGLPFLTGSVWCAIPIFIAIILLIIRTILEDKTLINELDGYINYTQKTKFKLIPYVW